LGLLEAAVKTVSGGRAKFVKNQKTFRTYTGQDTACDHAIIIEGQPYDIGIKRNADGTFGLIADFTMMFNTSPFKARDQQLTSLYSLYSSESSFNTYEQNVSRFATGALLQEYALMVAEEQAAILGRMTNRVAGKNGSIALEIMERA